LSLTVHLEKWPEALLLARHGQSEANVRKTAAKAGGLEPSWASAVRDQDSPLTDLGGRQSLALGCMLGTRYPPSPSERLEVAITSPYLRAKQTVEGVVQGLGYMPEIVVEERVREIEFGIMDGIDRAAFRKLFPSEATRRERDGKYWYRPPGGENRPDVRLRVHSMLDTLNRDYVGRRVLIVCHSVVVLAFRSLLERWGEPEYLWVDREDDVMNCGLTVYERRENRHQLLLKEYNTVAEVDKWL
jgi:probable phosphoglycerate mutase